MNPAIVHLPSSPLPFVKPWWFDTAPVASLWFPDAESKAICMKAFGISDRQQIILQSGDYQIVVNTVPGANRLMTLPRNIPRLFYLSPRIFSSEHYFIRPQPSVDTYSFYLFNRVDLQRHENEGFILTELHDDAKNIFHTTPFLGRNTPEDYPALKQWLAHIVLLINMRYMKEHSDRRLETAYHYASAILNLQPSESSNRIEHIEQLLALLALRQHGSYAATYMSEVETVNAQVYKAFEPLSGMLNNAAQEHISKTHQYVYNIPFTTTLGNEVLPALRRAKQALQHFAEKLEQSPYQALQSIGEEMVGHLATRTPVLALTGTFSSGKTTLLNSLLIGQDSTKIRAFRTKQGANTAIVSEITHVGAEKNNQRVEFEYRKKITYFPLATITAKDVNISSEYIREIQALLKKGVLTHAELRIMPVNSRMGNKGAIEVHSNDEIQKSLRYLLMLDKYIAMKQREDDDAEKTENATTNQRGLGRTSNSYEEHNNEGIYTISAEVVADALAREYLRPPDEQVNLDGTVQYRLPRKIDLTTNEGWEDFQGRLDQSQASGRGGRVSAKQNVKQHWAELDIATLLVERSRVYLNHSLLELTTIADTPGTDSVNAGHDQVTKGYLQEASAYIVLLPTHIVASDRANTGHQDNQDEANHILTQLVDALKGDLSRVAFVVNCWNTDESTNITDKIAKYEHILCRAFNLTPTQWNALRNKNQNFFVVQLKGIQEGERPEEIHGYPSLTFLQKWIEKTFRSGKYRTRYNDLMKLLEDGWQQKHRAWIQKLDSLYQEAQERERLCKRLRQFQQDLRELTDKHLDDVRSFRQNFTSQGRRVTGMMHSRGAEPGKLKRPEDLNPWRDELKKAYADLNETLQDFANVKTLDLWIADVRVKAGSLPISLPALIAVDPAAQTRAWSSNRSFARYEVDDKFADVAKRWPDNVWKNIAGFFTSIRATLVKELQGFWEDQYAEIWSGRLETYLQRCEAFLEERQQAIQSATQQVLDEQERLNDPEVRRRLEQEYKQVISAFEALEQERRGLQEQLARALLV